MHSCRVWHYHMPSQSYLQPIYTYWDVVIDHIISLMKTFPPLSTSRCSSLQPIYTTHLPLPQGMEARKIVYPKQTSLIYFLLDCGVIHPGVQVTLTSIIYY